MSLAQNQSVGVILQMLLPNLCSATIWVVISDNQDDVW